MMKTQPPADLNQKTKVTFSRTWTTSETAFPGTSGPDVHFLPENIWKTQDEIDSLYENLQSMAEVWYSLQCFAVHKNSQVQNSAKRG